MTLTAVPTPPPAATVRRGRRWVLLGVGCVLAAAVAGTAWAGTHDPLVHGSGQLGFGRLDGGSVLPDGTVENALGVDFAVRSPDVGDRVALVLGLQNRGPLPVEVVDVRLALPTHFLAPGRALASAAPGGTGQPLVPLRPFRLGAGEDRDVVAVAEVTGCLDGPTTRGAGTAVVDRVVVSWRVLGVERTSEVPVGFRGSLSGLPQCS